MTPKPRSPMPIRVEIWDTKNRSGANRALVSDQAATRLDASRFDHGYALDALSWAPRTANFYANIASGLAIALFVVGFSVWMNWL